MSFWGEMLGAFFNIIQNLVNIASTIGVNDVIDMAVMSFLVYKTIKFVRETRAQQLVLGIILILVAFFLSNVFSFPTLAFLLDKILEWGVLLIIIMFQPELRRILEKMGRTKVSKLGVFPFNEEKSTENNHAWEKAIDIIAQASHDLASTATGALIVLERQTKLGEQIDTGTIINAVPSVAMFSNIFFPNTSLHDGAVIVRNGMILAAGCFLPKPQKEELINKLLGSRHRAAIGMSENSDAIVIVISEETGTISVAENGELTRGFNKDSLKKYLSVKILPEEKNELKKDKLFFLGKVKKK